MHAFALDAWVARMIRAAVDGPYLTAIAWGISGGLGALALVGWVALRADEKIYNLISPQPVLGSLHAVGDAVLKVNRDHPNNKTDVMMVVKLKNSNDRIVATHTELRATVNGKDLDAPIIVNGYVSANSETSLIVKMDDVPSPIDGNVLSLDARVRYNVPIAFPTANERDGPPSLCDGPASILLRVNRFANC